MVTSLEADVVEAFANHRRRLRRDGLSAPGWLATAETLCRFIVRSRLEPTNAAPGEASADDRCMSLLLSFEDAALALQISRRTVERMAKNGELPTVTVGGRPRVRRSDLDAFVQGLEVRSMAHGDAEVRAEHAAQGREEMSRDERARIESIVSEMSTAAEHRGDQGPVRVTWQRDAHGQALERRFATRAEAERFATDLSANPEPGPLVRLDIADGGGVSSPAPDSLAVKRAALERKRH